MKRAAGARSSEPGLSPVEVDEPIGCPGDVSDQQLSVLVWIRERSHSAQGGLGVVGIQMVFNHMHGKAQHSEN